jgi:hypothetical protein
MDFNGPYLPNSKPKDPILFETIIFGGEQDEAVWRWRTKQEALEGHQQIVDDLTNKIKAMH